MARKTVITKVLDADARDGIIEFPQNKTLYADQFTDKAPNSDEDREAFRAMNMKEVFAHYQPGKEGIELENEEGGSVYENFEFKEIKDFEDERLISQSEYMSAEKTKVDAYDSVIRQLEKNKTLRSSIRDEASREALRNSLKAILAELDNAE